MSVRMDWAPEEFHGLTDEEADEMKALGFHRDRYDSYRRCVAYGALCMSLRGLRAAQAIYKRTKPELAAKLGNIGAQLDAVVPDYETGGPR